MGGGGGVAVLKWGGGVLVGVIADVAVERGEGGVQVGIVVLVDVVLMVVLLLSGGRGGDVEYIMPVGVVVGGA